MVAQAIIWFLIASSSGQSSPTVVARFYDKESCLAVVTQIEAQSTDKRGMPHIKGICVSTSTNKVFNNGGNQ